jgi:hypothetical protein
MPEKTVLNWKKPYSCIYYYFISKTILGLAEKPCEWLRVITIIFTISKEK